MVGDQDADVSVFKLCHNRLNVLNGNWIDPCKRLVEHNELGINSQAPGNFRTTAFSSRQTVAQVFPYFFQSEFGNQLFQFFLSFFRGFVGKFQHRLDVVFHRHFPENRGFLGQVTYPVLCPFVNRIFGNVLIAQVYASFVRNNQSHSHVKRGGFSGPVRTQQADNFALFQMDGNVAYYCPFTVFFYQVFGT
ncbi:hypothetical protein SDC9_102429 [bioreactor metagenome]|uniref:Uncharacterized protein n=1 Tax=bioreactor metagenome TaxID=1076179 RepID=A0A645AQT9_9ZZZZ